MAMFLITGAGGFIGRCLARSMQLKNEAIRLLVRSDKVLGVEESASTEFIRGDLLEPETLIKATEGVEAVIHIAGVTHTFDKKLYFKVNAQGTKNLVQACEKNRVKKIIYISTRAISPSGGPYSRSKREAESIIKRSSLNYTILRVAEVYGGDKEKGIEQLIQTIRNSSIIPVIGRGDYGLQPVYVGDVVDIIVSASRNNKANGKSYNIAGPDVITYIDLVKLICESLNLKRRIVKVPVFVAFISSYLSALLLRKTIIYPDQIPRLISPKEESIKQAVDDLGYKPISFKEGLKLILG
ncbi:NAD-dependent epimerase/dehydratase family protein [Candidatus Omnitrophota bacterium]